MHSENRIYADTGGAPRKLLRRLVAVLLMLILAVTFTACKDEGDDTIYPVGTAPDAASSGDLYCNEITAYTGPFVEDGKNEQVENVAAILVENRSNEFLEQAIITYSIGSDKTAEFVLTGLPAGESAWVLEKQRLVLTGKEKLEFEDCTSTFRADAITETEDITVEAEGNVITVTNNTGKPLRNVAVYYKNTYDDGNYLGGITYMIGFDVLGAGHSAEKASSHYSENSRIVRYSFQSR